MIREVMLDLETFGTGRDAAIVTIGAVEFGSSALGPDSEFYRRIAFNSPGFGVTDTATVVWWLKQSEDARTELVSEPRVLLKDALADFASWLRKIAPDAGDYRTGLRLWSNGPTFDEVILRDAYVRTGLLVPWHFKASRCCRTILGEAQALGFLPRNTTTKGVKHSALDDAHHQAKGVMAIRQFLNTRKA